MARGSGKKRAHRSKRATKQFFNQGSQDGSASAPGEGESSTAQNPHPAPVPSSSSCLEHPHPTPCQSQTAHDETKPKAVILPRGYTFVTPLLHRAEKLQLITEYVGFNLTCLVKFEVKSFGFSLLTHNLFFSLTFIALEAS